MTEPISVDELTEILAKSIGVEPDELEQRVEEYKKTGDIDD